MNLRPHLAPNQRAALNERVKQQLSHYTNAGDGEEVVYDDSAILEDDFRKPTIRIILGVFAASLFAYFAAAPTFDAPNVWSNTFRFDTAFVIVWGPLLFWAMARFKMQRSIRIFLVLSLFIEPYDAQRHTRSMLASVGPTQTLMPGSGSAAVDRIPHAACVEHYDQRGYARTPAVLPGSSNCDSGAVEVNSSNDLIFYYDFD